MKHTVLIFTLPFFSSLSFGNENLFDDTFIQVLAERENTGCHRFHHITDETLNAELQANRQRLEVGNIKVADDENCYTAVYAEVYGAYQADNIRLFNIEANRSEQIFLEVEGNMDLNGQAIQLGNIVARDTPQLNSNIDIGSIELTQDTTLLIGNIAIKEGNTPQTAISVQSALDINDIRTSLGDVEAGNIIIDKRVLSETSVLSIKHDITLESAR